MFCFVFGLLCFPVKILHSIRVSILSNFQLLTDNVSYSLGNAGKKKGCGWFCWVLFGFSWLWLLVLVGFGWFWLVFVDFGWFWFVVVCFGLFWFVLVLVFVDFGWFWFVLVCFGLFWCVLVCFGLFCWVSFG